MGGTLTLSVGFQPVVVELTLSVFEPLNAVTGTAKDRAVAAVGCPGFRIPTPEDTVTGPDQIDTLAFAMLRPPPVVKFVAVTVAVQLLLPDRPSTTVTVPS